MFEGLARAHDVDFLPLPGDPREGLITTAAADLGNNPFRMRRWLRKGFRPVLRDLFRLTLKAVEGSDLVLSVTASIAAFHVAERLGIPAVSAQFQPTTLTRTFPGPVIRPPRTGSPSRAPITDRSPRPAIRRSFRCSGPSPTNAAKTFSDFLPSADGTGGMWMSRTTTSPMVYAYSPTVLPRPSEWGAYKQVSGYWFLDGETAYEPPGELAEFLDRGPPPVYVGIGSLIDHEREEMTRILMEAMKRAGQRMILHTGWSELGSSDLPESVFLLDEAPHDWLFPRIAAVVHHGGAGTTAAGLRAGLPTVVVPPSSSTSSFGPGGSTSWARAPAGYPGNASLWRGSQVLCGRPWRMRESGPGREPSGSRSKGKTGWVGPFPLIEGFAAG